MTEDNKPLYDIESYWELMFNVPGKCAKYMHKEKEGLYRIIDFANGRYMFYDSYRVQPEDIIDINYDIGIKRKVDLHEFVIDTINVLKPISMPYIPERIKVYIEDLGEYVGLLYYRSDQDSENIVPVKRYAKVTRDPVISFSDVSPEEYRKYRNPRKGNVNVDNS